MIVEQLKIEDLKEDPENARKHNKKNLAMIQASLQRFGEQHPIVVTMDNIVIAGNGRYQAAKALGWEHISAIRTGLDGKELKAFGVADNRTGDTSKFDNDILAKTLSDIALEEDALLEAAGFSTAELDRLVAGAMLGGPEDGSGQVKFSEELFEENQYLVLTFRNEIDWLQAKTLFGIETVRDPNQKTLKMDGTGRVLDGAKAIARMIGTEGSECE